MDNKNSIFHKGKERINFKKKRFDGWQPITAVFTVANEGKNDILFKCPGNRFQGLVLISPT